MHPIWYIFSNGCFNLSMILLSRGLDKVHCCDSIHFGYLIFISLPTASCTSGVGRNLHLIFCIQQLDDLFLFILLFLVEIPNLLGGDPFQRPTHSGTTTTSLVDERDHYFKMPTYVPMLVLLIFLYITHRHIYHKL